MDISTQYGSKTISIDIWSNQQVSYRLIWPLLKQNAPKAEKNASLIWIFKYLIWFDIQITNVFQSFKNQQLSDLLI